MRTGGGGDFTSAQAEPWTFPDHLTAPGFERNSFRAVVPGRGFGRGSCIPPRYSLSRWTVCPRTAASLRLSPSPRLAMFWGGGAALHRLPVLDGGGCAVCHGTLLGRGAGAFCRWTLPGSGSRGFRGRPLPWRALHGQVVPLMGHSFRAGSGFNTPSGKFPFGILAAQLHSLACQLIGGPTSGPLHLAGSLMGAVLRPLWPLIQLFDIRFLHHPGRLLGQKGGL